MATEMLVLAILMEIGQENVWEGNVNVWEGNANVWENGRSVCVGNERSGEEISSGEENDEREKEISK